MVMAIDNARGKARGVGGELNATDRVSVPERDAFERQLAGVDRRMQVVAARIESLDDLLNWGHREPTTDSTPVSRQRHCDASTVSL